MELKFIDIDGFYGGDQHWLPTERMQRGGCSTVTAAEICIFLSSTRPNLRGLYSGDPYAISKEEFVDFAAKMFEYVYPRPGGLTQLSLYTDGIEEYAKSVGVNVSFECMDGFASYEQAADFFTRAIDEGCCMPCLLLEHEDQSLDDILWHWFTLTGYEFVDDELFAVFATYGQRRVISFRHMWNTGREKRGGLIRVC